MSVSDRSNAERWPRRLVILGATGSIGVNTLTVVRSLPDSLEVVGLAAGSKAEAIAEQAEELDVPNLALSDEQAAGELRQRCPDRRVFGGEQAATELVEAVDADMLVAAIVGAAGLPATMAAIRKGMDVALANKETLVAAGELVVPMAREQGVRLLPVDSEHSAIFQCLQGVDGQEAHDAVERLVLTASGGPFRNATKEEIENATVAEAMNHPTWSMGPKITIDSATMMNKALERIEAHWLFGLGPDRIDVIIHPQSIAHSFVEFADRSILAQLGMPDMKVPIQYALTYPWRRPGCGEPLDWTRLTQLAFEPPDYDRFPSLSLAGEVVRRGGTSGAVFNGANEAAVELFLDGRIRFGRIVDLVAEALEAVPPVAVDSLATVREADRDAREAVRARADG